MFTEVAAKDLLREVRAHDFGSDPVHEAGANRIDAITALDRAIRAAQAEQLIQIAELHRERSAAMGIGRGDPSLSVIGEVGMARNIGPTAAGTQLGLALGMDRLPRVRGLLQTGHIPESVARAVVNQSVCLHFDDMEIFDAEIAPVLPGLTTIKAGHAAARAVIRLDSDAALGRAERSRADQRVSMFPDTDGAAILQVRGPAEQIVATFNALDGWARGLRSTGNVRTTGQLMCQTLVERVTGVAHADDLGVEVQLVMDAPTLLAQDGEPVDLVGYGPISPDIADDLIALAPSTSIRRLLVDPVDGTLIARDPRRRLFDPLARAHIRTRDRRCRQPGNGAIAQKSRSGDGRLADPPQRSCPRLRRGRSHHDRQRSGTLHPLPHDQAPAWLDGCARRQGRHLDHPDRPQLPLQPSAAPAARQPRPPPPIGLGRLTPAACGPKSPPGLPGPG
ncbi:HNH endonuclease [Aeromicrobium sp.]|uniref:HNH endonuclease n=1 Tax=Aeromicrobium sp. TaxID=1871063 RepID=UPI0030C26231